MAVSKPGWLRSWLSKLNWDIFTWRIYVGDAIEDAIDWSLGWVNWGIDQATLAYNKAVAAASRANEVWRELTAVINRGLTDLGDKIDTWWDELGDWFETKRPTIEKWISVFTTPLSTLIDMAQGTIDKVSIAWDTFRTQTLPKLLDTQWITDFFGKGVQTIGDWWTPRKKEIDEQIDTEVGPVRKDVNKQASWWETITGLITNPLETIIGWLLKIGKTHQELMLKLFDKVMDALWG